MLNFPVPYANELIYSSVARAGIRLAINSPKQLLDEVFQDREVVATIDLPAHLSKILKLLPETQFNAEKLIYQHTLFPLYAPFVPEERRQECMQWMLNKSNGSVHLALGINASYIATPTYLQYCPGCINEQLKQYKEYYWSRLWQVQGVTCCQKHGELIQTNIEFRSPHKHEFIAADVKNCPIVTQSAAKLDDLFICKKVDELLQLCPKQSASFEQWSLFYKKLAHQNNCVRGNSHILYESIYEKISTRWSKQFLKQYHLDNFSSENSWLRSIFRKHRKCFSYLQHLIVIEAMNAGREWSFNEILVTVNSLQPVIKPQSIKLQSSDITESQNTIILEKRKKWLEAINQDSIIASRKQNRALYAWLYRNDKEWLLETNSHYQQPHIPTGNKIDWGTRDLETVKLLINIKQQLIENLDLPRKSKNWWIKQLKNPATIEKNLDNLPLTKQFLDQYNEDISCFQIRRLTRVLLQSYSANEQLPRWIILRKSGLSEERITTEANNFLTNVIKLIHWEN